MSPAAVKIRRGAAKHNLFAVYISENSFGLRQQCLVEQQPLLGLILGVGCLVAGKRIVLHELVAAHGGLEVEDKSRKRVEASFVVIGGASAQKDDAAPRIVEGANVVSVEQPRSAILPIHRHC